MWLLGLTKVLPRPFSCGQNHQIYVYKGIGRCRGTRMSLVPQNLLKNQSDFVLHPRPGKSEVRALPSQPQCSSPHRSKPVRESGHQESGDSEGWWEDEITQIISLWLAKYFQVLLFHLPPPLPLPIFLSWAHTLLLTGKLESISAHFNTETSLKPS